jgi:hypothetical protein
MHITLSIHVDEQINRWIVRYIHRQAGRQA